ncbi:hypothetical protein HPIN_00975 [Helicobacter pylori India7]|uniref:Uncharacterized protein n=1 Tax=Helicobacter pylori (strain India7) TaxID=907238 RepID=E8QE64_HELP7|nr:hypothetical protein HPIN_00975 [Helicobacter pylori India7]
MALDDFLTCFEFSFMSFAIEQNKNPIFIWSLAV